MRLTRFAVLPLLALSLGFTACGDDDDGDGETAQPEVFEVQATDQGKETGITAPASVRPGAVEIRFSNEGKRNHSLQIIRVGEGHSVEEALETGTAWGDGRKPLPEWISFVGGIGSTKPGGSGITVVDLPAGDYAAFDVEAASPQPFAAFTVEGEEGPALPEVSATIEAVDYDFTATAVEPGSQSVLFQNSGQEPHHLVAAPMKPGGTQAELEKAVKDEGAPVPVDQSKSFTTAIVSGGESAVVDLRFESGDYALVCFIPDRTGGPPHAEKGMATITKVQ